MKNVFLGAGWVVAIVVVLVAYFRMDALRIENESVKNELAGLRSQVENPGFQLAPNSSEEFDEVSAKARELEAEKDLLAEKLAALETELESVKGEFAVIGEEEVAEALLVHRRALQFDAILG